MRGIVLHTILVLFIAAVMSYVHSALVARGFTVIAFLFVFILAYGMSYLYTTHVYAKAYRDDRSRSESR